ncbi:pseudouridine synthase [Pseudobutyrivibrio xylanivorans]|uniref:Pseudouridine synthase n=1 Tax=Pseudobutyrivibrio xylanivorans TaxID=185007 RepID=A0A1G5RQX1_PSEXY|nr:pseudouridine synthase [Pseudobutyrivibrio xylanivorans]SCZ76473.1 16S rRNA pseudouridine516 synthase [Pseudobutyrivibrio xylanivorans]
MMRLDKLLVELNIGTRSEVKALLKKGLIFVDGEKATKPETKVDENTAQISYQGKEYTYKKFSYYVINKPKGVITATEDAHERTIMDVFYSQCPDAPKGLAPVGRLDKDTTGLLLITNDGQLAHDMLSPKKHVDKTYYVELDGELTSEDVAALEAGVRIGEGDLTAPATVKYDGGKSCYITIHEGKFHQVKRMFFAVGKTVLELKRTAFGPLVLDEEKLPEGHISELKCESFSCK